MGKSFTFFAAVMTAGIVGTSALADSGLEPPMDLLASQIRDQGFTCNKPKTAKRDDNASRPNAVVWILTCENDTYRMTVVPNLAAKVEKLD